MSDAVKEHLSIYKLAWTRLILYVFSVIITQFLAIAQTTDLDAKWLSMGPFEKSAFWLGLFLPAFGIIIAFLDKSQARGQAEKERRQGATGMTQFFTKPDTGP